MMAASIGRHRGGINDAASLFEMGQCSLGNKEIRKYIGAKGGDQLFFTDVFQIVLGILLSRIIHYDVQSPKFLDRLLHDMVTMLLFTYITWNQDTFCTFFFDESKCLLRILVFVQVGYGHICAFF